MGMLGDLAATIKDSPAKFAPAFGIFPALRPTRRQAVHRHFQID
jgi:hypothetical protein